MRQHLTTLTTTLASTLFAASSALAGGGLSNQSQSPDMSATAEPESLDLNTKQGPFLPPDYFSRDDYRARWAQFNSYPAETDEAAPIDLDVYEPVDHEPGDDPHTPGHDDGKEPKDTTHQGDLNADNVVDVADLVSILADWGVCPVITEVCRGDLNGDGFVDVADLVQLTLLWD